jgi:hypothetical protein
MTIENRELAPATKLVARYKAREHTAEVVATEDGLRYRLEDGREFKSLSSAGSALMEGKACNGWRFWSLAGDKPAQGTETKAPRKPSKRKATPGEGLIQRMDDGRYFCNACMEAFDVADDQEPTECPQGHGAEEPATT